MAINNQPRYAITASRVLIFVAVILFVLAAFGVTLGKWSMTDIGLAFFAAGFLF